MNRTRTFPMAPRLIGRRAASLPGLPPDVREDGPKPDGGLVLWPPRGLEAAERQRVLPDRLLCPADDAVGGGEADPELDRMQVRVTDDGREHGDVHFQRGNR